MISSGKKFVYRSVQFLRRFLLAIRRFVQLLKSQLFEPELPFFDKVLDLYMFKNGRMKIVQIGANDGVNSDPIFRFIQQHKKQISAVMVEPVAEYYTILNNRYKNNAAIVTDNVAIHNEKKEMVIYKVNEQKRKALKLPRWSRGIASFNPEHHKLTKTPFEIMEEEIVACITFEELLKKHNAYDTNLLQIDTEGYDAEILLNIDFENFRPDIIHFEHGFPNRIMPIHELEKIKSILSKYGYQL